MSPLVSLRLASTALVRNRLRTGLTLLGLVIGVAAVITMVALGEGAQVSVDEEMKQAGTNLIVVAAGNYTRGGESVNLPSGFGAATTLTPADADAVRAEVTGVRRLVHRVAERAHVNAGRGAFFARIQGTTTDWPGMYSWTLARGEFFAARDVEARADVVVLGATAASRLFGSDDPVGGQVQFLNTTFRVAGVAAARRDDQNDTVFLPVTTLQRLLGITHLHGLTVEAVNAGEASRVARDVRALLRRRHGLDAPGSPLPEGPAMATARPDDFEVKSQTAAALTKGLYTTAAVFALANLPQLDRITLEEMTSTLGRANQTMTALLASIAGVSLVVGGIGIMNIMLVAVTERTREIGLRMATGARGRDVLQQFLVEALVISLAGGVVGVVLGAVIATGLTRVLAWPTAVRPSAVATAFGISAAIGVVFGYYPARKASRLDPIHALRRE